MTNRSLSAAVAASLAFARPSCEEEAPALTREALATAAVDHAEQCACTSEISVWGVEAALSGAHGGYALESALIDAERDQEATAAALADAALELEDADEEHPLHVRYREARASYHASQARVANLLSVRLAG